MLVFASASLQEPASRKSSGLYDGVWVIDGSINAWSVALTSNLLEDAKGCFRVPMLSYTHVLLYLLLIALVASQLSELGGQTASAGLHQHGLYQKFQDPILRSDVM